MEDGRLTVMGRRNSGSVHVDGRKSMKLDSRNSASAMVPSPMMRHGKTLPIGRDEDQGKRSDGSRPTIVLVCCEPIARAARWLCETKEFTLLTTFLTIYALVGDDIRLMCTRKSADSAFDIITLVAMSVFMLDILCNAIGKDDYLLSFLFILDMVSTSTMFLDLTWVADSLQSDEEDLDHLRGSRTARMGAKAGRVVRVIRLVRILKLYKAIYEANSGKMSNDTRDEDDDWGDADLEKKDFHEPTGVQEQTLVGKKLAQLTIRRVICLVLLMMLILPLLRVELTERLPLSASYGADRVMQTYSKMVMETDIPGISGVVQNYNHTRDRLLYERALLKYIYHHNWFTAKLDSCPQRSSTCPLEYWQHVFWVGIAANDEKLLKKHAKLAQVRQSTFEQWAKQLVNERTMYTYGDLPEKVEQLIVAPWNELCVSSSGAQRMGLSLLKRAVTKKDYPYVEVKHPINCPDDLRRVERLVYQPLLNEKSDWRFLFYFDARSLSVSASIYSILVTVFVCISLCTAAMFFTTDANRLVLNPVESMIAKVRIIRNNPLCAIRIADEDFRVSEAKKAIEEKEARRERRRKSDRLGRIAFYVKNWLLCRKPVEATNEEDPMETVILESTIIKLGSLLALGFGEAGALIIGQNIGGVDSAMVDPMVPGRPVDCIMGVISISDFETLTEVLQGKVVQFVNQVAEIVHGVVDEFHGAVNKNDGDTFLTIWRTTDMEDIKVKRQADMSMTTVARIIALASRSPVLAAYRKHPGLQYRIDNYRVNLTCGLHFGWSIEGAVGSEFKIDASYMSPNVSTAEAIEQLTRIYGVTVLVSHSVVDICSQDMASKCRLIDRVKLDGWTFFLELFTIDLDHMILTVEPPQPQPVWNTRQRFRARQLLDQEKNARWNDRFNMAIYFQTNPDIAAMRFRYTLEFIHVFNNGLQNYLEGEWAVAERLLRRASTLLGVEDGPSLALLRYMDRYNYRAHPEWCGVRDICRDELT
eukprot:TRINITY_DN24868_c0_g1_i1.p1 TRINITY_DN24868_c0_g1~~TRINITY_DN24868_c0_g1_i1.p1  ORF type:complete len:985 (+),score=150.21 TRINITY_DN24868_c0_g1_i1:265-3219(+)